MLEENDDASRAEIPPMMLHEERSAQVYTPQCRQRWGKQSVEGAISLPNAEDIEEFLTEFAWLKESEIALQCLFDSGFDLPKAVQLLHAARKKRHKAQRDWNEHVKPEAFINAIETHGKKFYLVKRALGQGVTTREVVSKYYLWKRTTECKKWLRRLTNKKHKKKKEIELLRLGNESDVGPEAETFGSIHSNRCELCATGGRLLCCDGCTRAYHFSCVQAPIPELPRGDDDWFCPFCQKVFGSAKPKMIPSQDNKYCKMCLPFAGVPRTLMQFVTTSSNQEKGDRAKRTLERDDLNLNNEISNHDAASSALSSTEKVVLNIVFRGSLTNAELDTTRANALSCCLHNDRITNGKQEHKPAGLSIPNQPSGPTIPSHCGSSQATSNIAPEHFVETNSAEMGKAFVHVERTVSGRKRHRKTMAPRRIPPSQVDNSS
ncbi:unnamed protein product [Peronospora belbahrii]|uniref:PHD-type domain-containing protein n=1 Tax=Peronospora belbahrii TaxID=622444 RepID=A0ABN8DBZ3_9STRA|nr:unnamed protein product [Peronospora belbahrii]